MDEREVVFPTQRFISHYTLPATLEFPKEKAAAILDVSYSRYDPSHLLVRGILIERLLPSQQDALFHAFNLSGGTLPMYGLVRDGRTLRLQKPLFTSLTGSEFELQCAGFTLADEDALTFKAGTYHVEARFPRARLLHIPRKESKSAMGTIEWIGTPRDWLDGIKWDADPFSFVAADFYQWEHDREDFTLCRIETSGIRTSGEIREQLDPPSMISMVERAITDPMRLFSFLSRRSLFWYEIEASFVPEERTKHRLSRYLKRIQRPPVVEESHPPLVLQQDLADAFARILHLYANSPLKDWLERSMVYCVASYEKATIETQLGMAYLSIESLTEGFALIKQLVGRNSLRQRMLALLKEARIQTNDLWPLEHDLEREIQALIDRRNDFIHRARVLDDLAVHAKDIARLQAIVERAILSLLGWDMAKINPRAYDDLMWLKLP